MSISLLWTQIWLCVSHAKLLKKILGSLQPHLLVYGLHYPFLSRWKISMNVFAHHMQYGLLTAIKFIWVALVGGGVEPRSLVGESSLTVFTQTSYFCSCKFMTNHNFILNNVDRIPQKSYCSINCWKSLCIRVGGIWGCIATDWSECNADPVHCWEHLQWAREHWNWIMAQWKTVAWSEELCFLLLQWYVLGNVLLGNPGIQVDGTLSPRTLVPT